MLDSVYLCRGRTCALSWARGRLASKAGPNSGSGLERTPVSMSSCAARTAVSQAGRPRGRSSTNGCMCPRDSVLEKCIPVGRRGTCLTCAAGGLSTPVFHAASRQSMLSICTPKRRAFEALRRGAGDGAGSAVAAP
eukprot:scaffold15671_cov111-Isochrysis_galbana.AAC.5